MAKCNRVLSLFVSLLLVVTSIEMFALEGRFDFELNKKENLFAIPNRGYYNETEVRVKGNFNPFLA